jgi:hypothetical protein
MQRRSAIKTLAGGLIAPALTSMPTAALTNGMFNINDFNLLID